MFHGTKTGKPEKNSRVSSLTVHLAGNSKALVFKEAANLFKKQITLASDRTGVSCIFHTVESNHGHMTAYSPDYDSLIHFMSTFQSTFTRLARNLTNPEGELLFPGNTKVLDGRAWVTPVYSMEQLLTLICYQYHNSDSLREKLNESGKYIGKGKEYWNCTAADYEKGFFNPKNDILLKILQMTWPQLQKVLLMEPLERKIWIYNWAQGLDPVRCDKILKIDPSKPFTEVLGNTQVKEKNLEAIPD